MLGDQPVLEEPSQDKLTKDELVKFWTFSVPKILDYAVNIACIDPVPFHHLADDGVIEDIAEAGFGIDLQPTDFRSGGFNVLFFWLVYV